MGAPVLFSFRNVSALYRGKQVLKNLDFEVREGEHWALLGTSGGGKTALLETLAGNTTIAGGALNKQLYETYQQEHREAKRYLNFHSLFSYLPLRYQFKNLSNTSEFFYQQRFNAAFSDDAPDVRSYLTEIGASESLPGDWDLDKVAALFQLESLMNKELIKLSNGETKRLRLAATLLRNPKVILLDHPLIGLDKETRTNFNQILEKIAGSGITLIMATDHNEIPAPLTHAAIFHGGQIVKRLERKDFPNLAKNTLLIPRKKTFDLKLPEWPQRRNFKILVRLRQLSVRYGQHLILDDVNWEIKPGERWALQGPNGAGKSTLLSMINGDNPQAYANDIVLFDRQRGSGESIWDLKKQIGFVSPELLQHFHTRASCREVVASGFSEHMGIPDGVDSDKEKIVSQWIEALDLKSEEQMPFNELDPAKQRLVLIARACVKAPALLIFDEPCQGLTNEQQQRVRRLTDEICKNSGTALIYVTHYDEEMPSCINRKMLLDKGRIVGQSATPLAEDR